jgi:hypothetical protein
MSKTKSEIIAEILPLLKLPPYELSKMRTELEGHTVPELNAYLSVVSGRKYQAELAELAEDAIARVQGERNADRILFQLQIEKASEPQRRIEAAKQLAEDKETFTKICRRHSLSECDANFHLFRTTHSISGLAPASQEELVKFEQDRVETHNDTLQRMGHDQLREKVREEAEARQEATRQEQAARELESAKQRDQYGNFRPLPPEITAKAIKTSSALQLKNWMRLYGSFQITNRVRGEN